MLFQFLVPRVATQRNEAIDQRLIAGGTLGPRLDKARHDIVDIVPPSAKHFDVSLHTLDRVESVRAGNLDRTLPKIAEAFRRRSIIALITDCYDQPGTIIDAVNALRQKGNELIVFHVLDPAEISFDYDDAVNFEDLETGERLQVVPSTLRERYRTVMKDHTDTLAKLMGENHIDYALFDTSTPLDQALFAYLSTRQRMTRVR